jgi:hypothetical protein
MSRSFPLLSVVSLLWAACTFAACLDDKDKRKKPLSVTLEPVTKTVKKGTVPKFLLTIRNDGKAPEKVVDIRRRVDLQHTYYDLEVLQDGKVLELPRMISDPGPVSDEDWATLKPGQKITFQLVHFPTLLERLPPGKYIARVQFWQDPFQSSRTKYPSTEAESTVEK